MAPNDEKGVDPTVEAIAAMFPEDFLRNTARETGVVRRGVTDNSKALLKGEKEGLQFLPIERAFIQRRLKV